MMALRTGFCHKLCSHTPWVHSFTPACAVPKRSAGALTHSPISAPHQPLSHLLRLRAPPPRSSAVGSAQAPVTVPVMGPEPSSLGSPLWQQFSAAVSGEWAGITVTFTAGEDGVAKPQELPSRYVPNDFAEWGVKVVDWHTQHSTLAGAGGLASKLKRLFPIVGCEADAVAFEEQQTHTLCAPLGAAGEAKTVLADGSYSIGPRQLAAEAATARVEHCLMRGAERRARVVFNLKRLGADNAWRVLTTEVHLELLEGPYIGGVDLAACGYSMAAFGEGAPLGEENLAGPWRAESSTRFGLAGSGALVGESADGLRVSSEDGEGLQRYPGDVWTVARTGPEGILLEAGWQLDDDVRKVAVRTFSAEGRMVHTSFATERRGVMVAAAALLGAAAGVLATAGGGASTSSGGGGGGEAALAASVRRNVLGGELQSCCTEPGKVTGYFRDGFCRTVDHDHGTHVICAVTTDEFLRYTKAQGNDLSTPRPPSFPGWRAALENGVAPPVVLESTAEEALQFVTLEQLKEHEFQG